MKALQKTNSKAGRNRRVGLDRDTDTGRRDLMFRQVLETAATLFAERGYAGTSLQNIADAVGLSRPSLYHYVDSKAGVLEALVEDVTMTAANLVEEIDQRDDVEPPRKLEEAVAGLVQWVLERKTLFQLVDRSEAELPEEIAAKHEAAKRRVLKAMTSIIRDGVLKGAFVVEDERIAALGLIGMCNWSAWWYSERLGQSKADVARILAEMSIRSLMREETRALEQTGPLGAIKALRSELDYLETLINEDSN